ncbi:MAG: hypothetical protein AB1611_09180 [bacterium]
MRMLLILKLFILAFFTCILAIVMLPAMILGGTRIIREVYTVVEREFSQLRRALETV